VPPIRRRQTRSPAPHCGPKRSRARRTEPLAEAPLFFLSRERPRYGAGTVNPSRSWVPFPAVSPADPTDSGPSRVPVGWLSLGREERRALRLRKTPSAPTPPGLSRTRDHTGCLPFPLNNFKYFLTLFSKFFSSFPHGTCSLSVSRQYLALEEIYLPFRAAIPNNSTR